MKIVKLTSSNVMKLTAVAVEPGPDQSLVIVGGPNGAGKTSVLDSIAMALGGASLTPEEPLRLGQAEGSVEVDLGDMVITRKFKRDRAACDCVSEGDAHAPGCAALINWGPTRGSLVVKTKDGAVYSSPQAMLDKLFGKLAFDPLSFSRATATDQVVILQKLVGLNTTDLDHAYKSAYGRRAELNKQVQEQKARLKLLPTHEHAPLEELDLGVITAKFEQAQALEKVAAEARTALHTDRLSISYHESGVEHAKKVVLQLEKDLLVAKSHLTELEFQLGLLRVNETAAIERSATATAAVPDLGVIQAEFTAAQATNKQVRDNYAFSGAQQQLMKLQGEVSAEDNAVKEAVEAKRRAIAALKFPIEGLSFGEHGVLYNGVPFAQASSAERLRVSVAIGLALNPTLRVLLVRDGSLLDDQGVRLIGEQATAANAQLWLEYTTTNPEGVTVMLEDGSVVA